MTPEETKILVKTRAALCKTLTNRSREECTFDREARILIEELKFQGLELKLKEN